MTKSYIQTRIRRYAHSPDYPGETIHEISIMVPPGAQKAIGKKTIRRRLETSVYELAVEEAKPLIAEYLAEIDRALGALPVRLTIDTQVTGNDRAELLERLASVVREYDPSFQGDIKIAKRHR